ncbi:MAG: leucine-rich repeat domain-containing protein [Bacteroidales bacterium]|nr:leucine-rich repeat domain-containing protein [Bacteroidales bacterium]
MLNRSLQLKRALRTVLFSLLLSVAGVVKTTAQTTFTVGNLYYSINDDGASVTLTGHVDGTAATGELNIPKAVFYQGVDYPVTAIGEYAFYKCSGLTGDLVIPNSVIRIESSAFALSYRNSPVGNLTIPNSVVSIGGDAFNNTFFYGPLVIPQSVTSIGDYAFNQSLFSGELFIHDKIAEIGERAFAECLFTLITVAPANNFYKSIDGVLFSYDEKTLMQYPRMKTGASYTIPNTVTRIDDGAFSGSALENISIPASVCSIGSYAFLNTQWHQQQGSGLLYLDDCCLGCYNPTLPTGDLVIREGTRIIADYAFGFNHDITSLSLPNSLQAIGNLAFYQCDGLTGGLNLPASLITIGHDAFRYCSGFTGSLTIPNSVVTIGDCAFMDCSGFTGSLTIPNSLFSIGDYAFVNCTGFDGRLSLGESVEKIGAGAFSRCSNFTGELVLPNSLTTLGKFAFYGCTGFTGDLIIPNSLTEIKEGTFSNFNEGPMGFDGQLVIPSSIDTIYDQAFCACNYLQSITVACETPPEIIKVWPDEEEDAFWGINKEIPVYVKCNTSSDYQAAEYWNQFSNFVEVFPYSLTVEAMEPDHCGVSVLQQPSCSDQAVVKAFPAENYVFVAWEENGTVVSTDAVYSFAVERDVHLVAKVKSNIGVAENLAASIRIYPNPSLGLTIIEAVDIKHVKITDLSGRCVFETAADGDEFEIDLSGYDAGVYLIRIETAKGVATKRVVVTR